MKITPINDNEIRIETDKGIFNVCSLVGGGLEIHSQEGKTMTVDWCVSPAVIGARKVVIKEEK